MSRPLVTVKAYPVSVERTVEAVRASEGRGTSDETVEPARSLPPSVENSVVIRDSAGFVTNQPDSPLPQGHANATECM